MSTAATGNTIFCDDIRQEASGKVTLVGCYFATLNFSGPAPGLLPVFGALTSISIPWESIPKTIRLVVYLETTTEKKEIFSTSIEIPESQIEETRRNSEASGMQNENTFGMTIPIQWVSLTIERPCAIKVRAYLDDEPELKLGAIQILFPSN